MTTKTREYEIGEEALIPMFGERYRKVRYIGKGRHGEPLWETKPIAGKVQRWTGHPSGDWIRLW